MEENKPYTLKNIQIGDNDLFAPEESEKIRK